MATNTERKCIVDHTTYKYCPHCGNYNSKETWRLIFCSENCMAIHDVYDKVKAQKISTYEAKQLLNACDMSNYENFTDEMKRVLGSVVEEQKKPAKKRTKIVNDIIEDEI